MKHSHLILHGSYGTTDENWFTWLKLQLEAAGHSVLLPQFPIDDWDQANQVGKDIFVPKNQSLSSWLAAFEGLLPSLDTSNLTVIAHSSAPLFMLHVLLGHPAVQLRKALFVAPFLGKIGDIWQIEKVNQSFYAPQEFNFEQIAAQIKEAIVFYSDNDPYVPAEASLQFASKIHAKTIEISAAGHFNTEAGYTSFPQILKYL